jgi:hypothetical protein
VRSATKSLKVFFATFIISGIAAGIAFKIPENKNQFIWDIYLRISIGLITGLFTGIGVMFGQDLYIYIKEKYFLK